MLSYLASFTFIKYSSWGGACPQTPLACSDRFVVLTGNTWAPTFTPGLPDF